MIRRGNEIYQYYGGGASDHGGGERGGSAIFRTVQRLDGFVSATAGVEGGELTTPLVRFTGRTLRLNVDTSASGLARVEVLDPGGLPAPGFELRNCRPIVANDTAYTVAWAGGSDLSALGSPIALRIELRSAHLYAFEFGA
jgi:hypothetical protein